MQREYGQPSLQALREQLSEAQDRVWEFDARLHETLASTSYRLGRHLVLAAKNPRQLVRLPADLWRLYRERGQDVRASTSRKAAVFLSYRSLERERQGLQIAAAASRQTLGSLASAFDVVALWPHDANEVVARAAPDLVLIESGATMPGQAWSALGTAIEPGLEPVSEHQRPSDVRHAAARILELADPAVWAQRAQTARRGVEQYDLDRVFPAWASILVEDRNPDAWV